MDNQRKPNPENGDGHSELVNLRMHARQREEIDSLRQQIFTFLKTSDVRGSERSNESDAGDLVHLWRVLSRYSVRVLAFAILGLLAGWLVSVKQTPLYQARTTVEVQALNGNFLNMANVDPLVGGQFHPESDIQTQVKLLQSRSLIERVASKLDLEKQPALLTPPSALAAWREALGLASPSATVAREELLALAAKSITVQSSPQNRILEISCNSPDARFAATFANTLVNEFIEQNLEARWNATQRTGEWLTRQIQELKIKLEKSEDELQGYAKTTGLLYTSDKESVGEEKLKQLQQELSRAQSERIVKQSQFEMVGSRASDSLPETVSDEPLRDYQAKLTDLRRQMAELSTSLTPLHPKVKRVQAQIAEVESAIGKARGNILVRMRSEFESAKRREQLIGAAYASQASLVADQGAKAVHYNILKREVETNRQLYEAMLQKVKEAGITSALRAGNIRVVDLARPPVAPYKPNFLVNSSLGLLAGVFGGVLFVLMRERADRSFRAPGDAPFYLNVPELGVIPSTDSQVRQYLSAETKSRRKKAKILTLGDAANGNGKALNGRASEPVESWGSSGRVEHATWQHKLSVVAESFRAVLTSILFSGQNGDRPRVILLSSPGPSEGKTTVASNLAIALAEIHHRVLLIDTDMRRPRLHEIFDVPNTWGLSDLLREKNSIVECPLEGLVRETQVPGLYLLPSGPGPASISSLLYSARLQELLRRLRGEFDAVLIDTPPMLLLPDARVLGRLADAVVLVVRAGHTTRDSALAAKQRFAEDGIQVLGTILNYWNPAFSSSSYGSDHYKNHYDHYSTTETKG